MQVITASEYGPAEVLHTLVSKTGPVTALGMPGAATAAPSGPSPVDDTVASLQAEGYKVIVTRLSGAESSNCSVAAIRPGQQITQETPTGGRGNHARQVVSNTVYVDVRC